MNRTNLVRLLILGTLLVVGVAFGDATNASDPDGNLLLPLLLFGSMTGLTGRFDDLETGSGQER